MLDLGYDLGFLKNLSLFIESGRHTVLCLSICTFLVIKDRPVIWNSGLTFPKETVSHMGMLFQGNPQRSLHPPGSADPCPEYLWMAHAQCAMGNGTCMGSQVVFREFS